MSDAHDRLAGLDPDRLEELARAQDDVTHWKESLRSTLPWLEAQVVAPDYPDRPTLDRMHEDCLTLINSPDPDTRTEALGRLLPYVARGNDLAFLLGFGG